MNPADRSDAPDATRKAETMSAMADGELPADEVQQGCRWWREDSGARATWHTYQLIADVMRSDQLASTSVRDAAFVNSLRSKLALEPTVVAPRPGSVGSGVRRWVASMAVFGGLAVVAGAMVFTRSAAPPAGGDGGARLAVGEQRGSDLQRAGAAALPASGQVLVIDGNIIRDARLDAYFDAHRGAVGAVPSAAPGGGALRSVEMIVPPRR